MTDADKDMEALDLLLADMREVAPLPGDDLMARILADAAAAMPAAPGFIPMPQPAPVAGWKSWLSAIGGWPAMGGMAVGTLAGVWIGFAPPTTLTTIAASMWGETLTLQLYPDDDPLVLLEG